MNALPVNEPAQDAPSAQVVRADEQVTPAMPWLYRSEGFAEDLDSGAPADDSKDRLSVGLRLAAPGLALFIGLAALLSLY
jgi:hypothetical protein